MLHAIEPIRLDDDAPPAPVNRPRLARYLELPSVAEMSEIVDAEVRKLEARRDALLRCWQRALAVRLASIDGPWIGLATGVQKIQATAEFGCRLRDGRADALIVTAFTVGPLVDELVKRHLERDELFEAFVLKQWAATMAEQARARVTASLQRWAQAGGRALMPYDGPGYNGWPLASLHPLLDLLYGADSGPRPVRATEDGVLLPINSMLIVYGVTPLVGEVDRYEQSLAQCHRCAMRNCRYRTAPLGAEVA